MTDNLFEGTNTEDNQPLIDPNKNYYEELVGEGKKFKTPEDLARAKAESDAYIQHLMTNFNELREDFKKEREYNIQRANLEELVNQLKAQASNTNTTPPMANEENNNKPAIDLQEIESLFSSKIQEYEMTKKQEENYNLVRSKLQEAYGANYAKVLKEQTETLGLDESFVNDLARKHPQLLFRTLGLDQAKPQEQFVTPPRSENRTGFTPSTQKRTYSFYQKLRKENPRVYWDPKTQQQMFQDHKTLGQEFEDGDWHRYN